MSTKTKRTPAAAYLAALLAVLLVWAAYRPLMHAWQRLQNEPPSVEETTRLLRSPIVERQREGLTLAAQMRPANDVVLTALSGLAFTAPDAGIRQQAAQYLSGFAQRQALPAVILQDLPALTPEMDPHLATTYGTLIAQVAQHQSPPPNAVAFLDALIEQGDWRARNVAVRAFGQIGFHHGLENARIRQLTAMAATENALGRQVHAVDVAWALRLIGQRGPLPASTIDVLVELMRTGQDAGAREGAVRAVATQLAIRPDLANAIEAALEDPDPRVRHAARGVLYERDTENPLGLDQALRLTVDEKEPGTRRLRALQRLLRQTPTDDRVRTIARGLARHQDPVLRAGVASMAGALPDSDADAVIAEALEDADPQVRAAAVLPFLARQGAESEQAQIATIRRLLGDPAAEVQRKVLSSIRGSGLNSVALRSALRDMTTDEPRLARERAALLASLERADRTLLQRVIDAVLEPKNYGVYSFIAVAGLAVLICGAFLLYYTARLFVYLSAREWRALVALGAVAVWVAVSLGLGWAFFIGAFMAGGHNSAPPLSAQFSVVGGLLLLVIVFALIGYGLRHLVRG